MKQDPMVRWGVRVFDGHAHFPYAPPEGQSNPDQDRLHGSELWGDWSRQYIQRHGPDKYRLLKQRNDEGQLGWWRNYNFPVPQEPDQDLDALARQWGEELDRHGIDGILFVTAGDNDSMSRVIRANSKFHGFAHHDPFAPGAAGELRRAISDLGLRGYKLFGPAITRPLSDPALDPLWQVCEDLQVPVLIHFGPLGGRGGVMAGANISPMVLHDVAKGFPTVPFIVPHFGCGFPQDLLHLMWGCDNVYVDTSGNNEWVRWHVPPLSLEGLFRQFRETVGAHRVIFGTDSSHFPRGFASRYLDDQLRAAREVGYTDPEIQAVFGGNIKRLLRLETGEASP